MKHFSLKLSTVGLLAATMILSWPAESYAKKDKDSPPPGKAKKEDSSDTTDTGTDSSGDTSGTTDTSTATQESTKTTGKPDKDSDDSSTKTTGKKSNFTVVPGSIDEYNPTVYHFENDFSLKNDVQILGHIKIVADQGFDFKNSEIQIGANSSITMYVKGDVNLRGNGEINTLSAPANFLIFGTGDSNQNVTLVGNSGISAVVYAPDADYNMKGTSGIFGAVIANNITNNGMGSTTKSFNGLNYDEALKDLAIGDQLTMEDYQILKAGDDFKGDATLGTYADFFDKF